MKTRLTTGTPKDAGMDEYRVAKLLERAETWAGTVPALQLLAARRGVIFLHEVRGTLRPGADSPPLTKDSLFMVGSVTKPFVATAVMMLVESGQIDINRPLQFYIPEFVGEGKSTVTLHHLLTHTSGLDDVAISYHQRMFGRAVPQRAPQPTEHPVVSRYLDLTYSAPLSAPPGKEQIYCSANYALLLEVVRRAAGQRPAEFLDQRLFSPLGMNDTYFGLPRGLLSERVLAPDDAPFAILDELFISGTSSESYATDPMGYCGLATTARDLATFAQMFLSRGEYDGTRVLHPNTVALMTRNQTPGLYGRMGYASTTEEVGIGYGWFIGATRYPMLSPSLASPVSFSHAGLGGAFLFVDPTHELVAVFLSAQVEFNGFYYPWQADLFANALISAIAA